LIGYAGISGLNNKVISSSIGRKIPTAVHKHCFYVPSINLEKKLI